MPVFSYDLRHGAGDVDTFGQAAALPTFRYLEVLPTDSVDAPWHFPWEHYLTANLRLFLLELLFSTVLLSALAIYFYIVLFSSTNPNWSEQEQRQQQKGRWLSGFFCTFAFFWLQKFVCDCGNLANFRFGFGEADGAGAVSSTSAATSSYHVWASVAPRDAVASVDTESGVYALFLLALVLDAILCAFSLAIALLGRRRALLGPCAAVLLFRTCAHWRLCFTGPTMYLWERRILFQGFVAPIVHLLI
eukprot:g3870.t1